MKRKVAVLLAIALCAEVVLAQTRSLTLEIQNVENINAHNFQSDSGFKSEERRTSMYLFHRDSHLSQTFKSGVLLLLIGPLLNFNVKAQRLSRDELSKEAGRIATAAERKIGEAHKKVQNGGDRKLIAEAEKAATESFVKAIELWREAGDRRLFAAVEELTRLYSVHGYYKEVVDRLTFEARYWEERGDVAQQIKTLSILGTRQWQMKRDAASAETLERVVDMSRSTNLYSIERNVLEELASVYDRLGRAKDAESSRLRAKELWAIKEPTRVEVIPPVKPPTIPAQWVDLPLAPLAAEYRVLDAVNQAVLVNRSSKGVEFVMFGCVLLEGDNKTRVLYSLGGVGLNHGGIRPGYFYRPFSMLNGPLNPWTDEKMGCEGAAKMAVIGVGFEDRTEWKADGTEWVVRSN